MVNFNPNIYYSDKASEAEERYQKAKKETDNLRQNSQKPHQTANFLLENYRSTEDLKETFENKLVNDSHLSYKERDYYQDCLKSYQTSLSEPLQNLLKNQEIITVPIKDLPDYFKNNKACLMTLYGKTYLVLTDCLEHQATNELMVTNTNALQVQQEALEDKKKALKDFTDDSLKDDLDAINALKTQMEAQIKALYEKQNLKLAALQEQIAKYEHDLFIMRTDLTAYEYRQGLGVNMTRLKHGQLAPREQPLTIYQKLIFLDEDLPRLTALYDTTSSSLEEALKTSDTLLEHFCPSNKAIVFLKQRRSQGSYELNNTVMKFIQNTMPNHIGMLIRNGDNVWLTWLDDESIHLNEDSFNSKASQETLTIDLLKSRHYLNNILLGFLERGNYLHLDHTVTNLFEDKGILFATADNQLVDTTYIPLAELLSNLNQYNQADDPIYLFNSIRDSRTSNGRGVDTYRGRGENGLSDGAIVHEGYHRINGIDVLNDLQEHIYVQAKKYPWSTNKVNLYIESDEYINLKFLTSDLIDYYIQSKRIGNLSNTGRYVDYVHMLPILFKIKDILIKQEKEDRLHIPAKDYDLNLLTAFKITHNIRNITTFQAKRYSKWLTTLSTEERDTYQKLLLINSLDAYVPKKDCYILYYKEYKKKYHSISSVTKKDMDDYDKDKGDFRTYHYVETVIIPYANPFDRLKTFSSLKKAQDFLKNEPIYLYNNNTPSWEIANLSDPNTIADFKTFLKR
jgi:hypothetical protein